MSEREKLAIEALGATSRAERIAISARLKVLEQQEIALAQQKIAVDRQQVAAKQALKVAYTENLFAQSQFMASSAASAASVGLFGRAVSGVKNEIRMMTAAALANPLMTLAMVVTTAGTALWGYLETQKMAREEALRYADTLDQLRGSMQTLTETQIKAEEVKLTRSIREQEKALADLKERQRELTAEIENGGKVLDDAFAAGVKITSNAKELAQAQEELALITADVESATNKLTDSQKALEELQTQVHVAQLRDTFAELFPNVDITSASTDTLTASINGFSLEIPSAVAQAMKLADSFGIIQQTALQAAFAVAQLLNTNVPQLSEKALKELDASKMRMQIAGATGKEKARLQALQRVNAMGDLSDTDREALLAQYEKEFLSQQKSGGGKTKTPKTKTSGAKAAEKAQKVAEKSADDYRNQLSEMTNRLAGLKADAANIAIFGKVSDYQEVRKLTEDIALNGEKYKGYGEQGVARLKELASQLDSAQQQVAISQFTYNNGEKLKAMEFELSLLGKTRKEQELMQFNHELDLEAARLKIGMSKENIALLEKEIEALKKRRAEIQAQAEETRGSWEEGIKQGWNNIEADVSNVAANVANITENAFNGMADAMTDFVMTGKADFKSMAESIIRDISNMIIKMTLFKALENSLRGTSFGNFLGIPVSSAAQGGLIGSVGMPKVMLGGFSRGGYTGDGGKYVPAGLVHRGELAQALPHH